MTGKGRRHDRGRHCVGCRHLLVVASILLIGAGCGRGREAHETPLAPEALRLAHIATTAMDIRIRPNGGDWSPWTAITDSMTLTSPAGTAVVQLRYAGQRSSLSGWCYPTLDTCFIMPAYEPSESAWRISYGLQPGTYPDIGRIEFRAGETHVTEARHHTQWYQAEMWDAGTYAVASPWFRIKFTGYSDYIPHEEPYK